MIYSDKPQQSPSRSTAFTLVEVMVSAALGAIVMAGVLTTFLMIGRSSVRIANYSMIETQTRVAFEQLGIDARMASNLTSIRTGNVITGFTLTIPTSAPSHPSYKVNYFYANSTLFFVPGPDHTVTTDRRELVTNATDVTFNRFDKFQTSIAPGTGDADVKHIQITVSAARSGVGVAAATQVTRSTAFTIRNKST